MEIAAAGETMITPKTISDLKKLFKIEPNNPSELTTQEKVEYIEKFLKYNQAEKTVLANYTLPANYQLALNLFNTQKGAGMLGKVSSRLIQNKMEKIEEGVL